MAMTPVEIRHVQLGRSLRGYRRETVDRLLSEVADSFEDVWRERADLADRVEQLELDLWNNARDLAHWWSAIERTRSALWSVRDEHSGRDSSGV